MTRALAAAPLAAGCFAAALLVVALAVRHGFVPDDGVRLWAGASMAGGGNMSVGHIVAAYPSVPFLATVLVALGTPDGTPAAALAAGGLLALIAVLWFSALRASGLTLFAAGFATLLLAFHPLLLRATIGGPAELCLVLFLYLFGRALYDLRARSTTPEVMAVGLALLALAFSHPIGAAVAFAATPVLIFAVQPVLAAKSAFNVVIVLIFPTVFAVGAFNYLSWVFPGAGWSFFAAPAQSLSAWGAGVTWLFGEHVGGLLALDAAIAVAIALALGAPLSLAALAAVRKRRPLIAPALVFAATIAGAAAVTVATGFFGDPAALATGAPVLAAIVAVRLPLMRERRALGLALLALGWLGGGLSLALVDPATAARLADMIAARGSDRERLDALALGGALIGRDDVLVDTDASPAVVLGRGRAQGLLGPQSERFALALLFGRLNTPFVAVPDPLGSAGAGDRLNRAFPALFRRGAADYRVIYQNNTWRLFERSNPPRVSKD